jgi:hypothetical protein
MHRLLCIVLLGAVAVLGHPDHSVGESHAVPVPVISNTEPVAPVSILDHDDTVVAIPTKNAPAASMIRLKLARSKQTQTKSNNDATLLDTDASETVEESMIKLKEKMDTVYNYVVGTIAVAGVVAVILLISVCYLVWYCRKESQKKEIRNAVDAQSQEQMDLHTIALGATDANAAIVALQKSQQQQSAVVGPKKQ